MILFFPWRELCIPSVWAFMSYMFLVTMWLQFAVFCRKQDAVSFYLHGSSLSLYVTLRIGDNSEFRCLLLYVEVHFVKIAAYNENGQNAKRTERTLRTVKRNMKRHVTQLIENLKPKKGPGDGTINNTSLRSLINIVVVCKIYNFVAMVH
jgi:hypothetical protein